MINDYSTETLTRLEPAYLEHYGLNEPPFASTLDERFFYPTGEINQQTNMLVHMTQYSDMLLLVTGDEGMGKTALLQHYLKSAHDNWHVSRVNANSMMDMDLLLFRIAEGFGLESLPGNSAELQELLLDKLSRLHANDILPVTIIDDADVLSQDAVELLYHLAEVRAEDGPMLHMVLFADPRIEATLQTSSVRNQVERMTHFIELQPLTEEETIQYINNRLRVAGVVDENLFAPKVFRKIFKMSGGVPARINELAHMALDDNVGAAAPDDDFDDEVYTKTAAMETEETETKPRSALRKTLLTILGMIILLLLWNQNNINRLLEGESLDDVLSSKPDIEKYMPKNQTEKPEESPFADPADKSPQTETTAVQQDTGKPDNIAANDKQGPQQTTGPAPAEDLTPVLSKLEPSPIHTGLRKIELTIHGKNFTRDSSVTLGWTGNTKQLGKKQYRVESDKVIRLQLTPGKKPDKWTLTVTDPKRGISNTLLFETVSADKKPQTEGQKENQQALD
ncbi:MAG: AAA family ATPase, partial [Gammaproteobacteria bacterium]|nr:AAA family ATPase [Gammaproteobacteria bacterium]